MVDAKSGPRRKKAKARSESGDRLTLYCVNRRLERDLSARIELHGFQPGPLTRVVTLAAPTMYHFNDESKTDAVQPAESQIPTAQALAHTFPRASVTILEFHK